MAARWKSFAKRIKCDGGRDDDTGQLRFTNEDLKPVEAARRQWRHISFVDFWIADSFNVNTFLIAAVSLDIGLSWWQAWLCVWFGYTVAAVLVCMNGRIGAVYHIGFPVANRSSFGIWGSLWPVLNRGVIACFWYGVQCWIGGQCVYLMISSIWPSFSQRPYLRKEIALGGTVNFFISFIIFWLGSLPFIWFPVHQIRHLFTVKAIVAPLGGIGLLVWVVARAASIGPVFDQRSTVHGSDLAWAMITAVMATLANMSTVIINNSDLTRFAKNTSSAKWPQLLAIPLSFGLTSFVGIMVGSASTVIFPGSSAVWNPLEVLSRFLGADENGQLANSAERAGVFFIAAAFTVAQLGVNIAANTISAGMDFTALMPRYINIRRGGYLCAIIGLVICPWQFLTSASKFTSYLSAYTIFLSSIVGTMLADYYFVRKGYIEVEQLYSTEKTGLYFGVYGFQWRGYAAYVSGICINIVGFVGITGVDVPKGATYIYRLSFLPGFLVSVAVYYLLSRLFGMPERPVHGWCELGDTMGRSRSAEDDEARPGEQESPRKLRLFSTVSNVLIGRRPSDSAPLRVTEGGSPCGTPAEKL